MGYSKTVHCATCGGELRVGVNTRKPRNCEACNMRRYIDNLASIMSKRGEGYERLIAAQRRARVLKDGGGGPETQLSKPSDCD